MAIKGPIERAKQTPTGKYFMYDEHVVGNSSVTNNRAERGAPVIHVVRTGATGAASGKWGDPNNAVAVPSGTAGVFAGALYHNVTGGFDESRQCFYPQWYGYETTTCRPLGVIEEGSFFTDKVEAADNPTVGAAAYWSANGLFTTAAGSAQVGKFTGAKDSDGFVGVDLG